MNIQDIMTESLDEVEAGTPIADAAMRMKTDDVGCLAVVRNGEVIGTITDRDVVIRAVAEGKDLPSTSVEEAMSAHPVFCRKDDSVETVAARMREQKIRRLIVQDESGRPAGMVSLGDLAARGHSTELTGEVMEEVCACV